MRKQQGFSFVAEEGLFHDPFWITAQKKPCQPPSSASGVFYFFTYAYTAFDAPFEIKNPGAFAPGLFLCSGGRIRTSDLWVMSPTTYHCSTPQYILIKKKSKNMSPTSYPEFSGLHPAISRGKDNTMNTISKTNLKNNFWGSPKTVVWRQKTEDRSLETEVGSPKSGGTIISISHFFRLPTSNFRLSI